ncbi:uncharacterized protein METZ01_LOCUS209016, partial [marine metagenome]
GVPDLQARALAAGEGFSHGLEYQIG